jgi:hypothetical protein
MCSMVNLTTAAVCTTRMVSGSSLATLLQCINGNHCLHCFNMHNVECRLGLDAFCSGLLAEKLLFQMSLFAQYEQKNVDNSNLNSLCNCD